jgi:hypothetical protein
MNKETVIEVVREMWVGSDTDGFNNTYENIANRISNMSIMELSKKLVINSVNKHSPNWSTSDEFFRRLIIREFTDFRDSEMELYNAIS